MGVGLAVSAAVSLIFGLFFVQIVSVIGNIYFFVMIAALIAEFVVAVVLTKNLLKYSKGTCWGLFIAYAALTGFTLSTVIYGYDLGSVFIAFLATAVLFVCMAVIGLTTKVDFTKFSSIAFIGLTAIIVLSLLNMFLKIGWLNMFISYIAIILFLALVAMDIQKLRNYYSSSLADPNIADKLIIMSSFQLYLDFINLFLRILQIFGKRKN